MAGQVGSLRGGLPAVSVVSFRSLVFQTAVVFLGEILLPIAMVLIKVGETPPALSHSGEGRLWEKGEAAPYRIIWGGGDN